MLNRAEAQAEILNLAQQVANNFHSIQGPIQGDLEECKAGSAGVITNNTWGSGCAFVNSQFFGATHRLLWQSGQSG